MRALGGLAWVIIGAGAVDAGGIDRAGQTIDILFREGNFAELAVTRTLSDVDGSDIPQTPPGFPRALDTGVTYADTLNAETLGRFGIKVDLTGGLSVALTGQPDFGTDLFYDASPQTSLLGGTSAEADAFALALLGRYRFANGLSLHGGVRRSSADGEIRLGGLAYGDVNGYAVDLEDDVAYGYLLGAAFERPEVGLRLVATYNSEIRHDFKSRETLGGAPLGPDGETRVSTPQTVNVDLAVGLQPNTLLLAGVRWAEWSEFEIAPDNFEALTGSGLVTLDDTFTYRLGVAQQLSAAFGARALVLYEPGGDDDLVSPLAPTNGFTGIELGGVYRLGEVEISGGVRHLRLGDAKAETGTPDVARARFEDNTVTTLALALGFSF